MKCHLDRLTYSVPNHSMQSFSNASHWPVEIGQQMNQQACLQVFLSMMKHSGAGLRAVGAQAKQREE